jgi:glycosyltransferase involved in cell wall biosynthesis
MISPEAPYPPVGGGALRAASLAEYLGRRYDLDLVLFREPGSPDPARSIPEGLARNVLVILLPHHSRGLAARAGRNLVRALRSRPPLNDRFEGFGELIRGFLDGRRYDVAVLEHFWSAAYCEQAAPHSERVVLDLHNVESTLLGSYATAARWPERWMFHRFQAGCLSLEKHWLPRFDLVLAASAADGEKLKQISPRSRIEAVPNTIPLVPQPDEPEEDAIVFSGNLGYWPNMEAIRFFRSRIWPRLRERWPGLVWRIIGKNPEAVRQYSGGDSRIDLAGPVEDAIRELSKAKVSVAPILAGSGTRVKILEAWAAGRAVVSTTLGSEGLGGQHEQHLLIADTAEDFAEAVSILLKSRSLRLRLGSAGRNLFETSLTWQTAWKRLDQIGI